VTFDSFTARLQDPFPPEMSPLLQALWYDHRGDWEKAHQIAQALAGPDAAHVHAYLHRKERDFGNAGYWYRRAGRAPAEGPLVDEWKDLVGLLLG
jgi:hypothetical protein